MWKAILRPDVLFTIATVQALSPYVFWQFGVGEFKGQANLTYLPVIIWITGWLAFMLGTRMVKTRSAQQPWFTVSTSERTITLSTIIVIVVICAQLVSLTRLYGGFPLLSYISLDGAINIGTAVALQEDSGVGQVGSLYVTTAVLHGLLLLLLIRNLEKKRRDQLLILLGFLVLLAAHGINAKRQGFVRCAVFFLTGLSLYAPDPLEALGRVTRVIRTKAAATAALVLVASLLFLSFGYLAYARNQGNYTRGSMEELIAYQEFSLVNFEVQAADAGLGPHGKDRILWLRRLIPWKLMDAAGFGDRDAPVLYSPGAPAGLYEDVHWSLGLPGVILFSFGLGVFTMFCFRKVLDSPFYLLAYCQISFSLMLAHSFNEFLSLSWIPAPLIFFWLICSTLRRNSAPGNRAVLDAA